ncbi:YceI family protein [Halalkalibaculum sp. DA3122]|uniref:YceI family protein n=1 Tax=unclassified Halalkalibaculum TaxID=2964617 RepID=UPI0037547EBB
MKRLLTLLLPVTLCLYIPDAEAQVFKTETGHAEFQSEVPLHTFTGTSDHLVGLINLADSTVDFYIDMNTFETGIGKRDKDMRRTLETDKYPFAEFYGKLISGFDTASTAPQEVTVRGEFGIHGVTRDVEITGTLQKTVKGLHVAASWTLNIEDYNIEPPGILFYRVDENQDIKIEATLTPNERN